LKGSTGLKGCGRAGRGTWTGLVEPKLNLARRLESFFLGFLHEFVFAGTETRTVVEPWLGSQAAGVAR